jgi:predicted mannosyl-3-phosphoglycerate phosphatase (HAD superfamily)
MLHQAFVNLGKVAVHLGDQPPTHPLTTVMDYAFKINVLAGELER